MTEPLPDENNLYDEVRKRIHHRYKRRADIAEHMVIFVAINVVLWVLWAFTPPLARIEVWIPLLISGVSLAVTLAEFFKFLFGELEDQAIQREIEAERAWRLQMAGKSKNDAMRLVQLADDGELVDVDDYDDAAAEEAARRVSR